MKKTVLIIILSMGFLLICSLAWGNFYVIGTANKAKRTVLVSPANTAIKSGTALLNALSKITDASATNPYLIIIEPGVYNIGGASMTMKSYVDMQGAGENVTKVVGNVDSSASGVIKGADNTELSFLTVENSGGGADAIAIYNHSSSPVITKVTATASGGTNSNQGVANLSSSPIMTNMTITASGGTYTHGIRNIQSDTIMSNLTITASGGSDENHGVMNINSSPTMEKISATAHGGTTNYGVYNNSSSPYMTNMTAETLAGGAYNIGVFNYGSSAPIMINVTATALDGTSSNYGVLVTGSSTVKIDKSVISGSTKAVFVELGTSTAYIANTRLEGGYPDGLGICKCASVTGVFEGVYTFHPSACPAPPP